MLGAIIGDIAGSRFEFNPTNDYNFELFSPECSFTDDTICTVAVADALLNGSDDYGAYIHKWCRKYPNPMGGYGCSFRNWVMSDDPKPYGSYGNGAAMRVSPIGWAFKESWKIVPEATKCAACSHNHPEGIKGARATAYAVRIAIDSWKKFPSLLPDEKREYCERKRFFDYALRTEDMYPENFTLKEKRNRFDETCQGTVPVALKIARDSDSFEDAIRTAVSLGADADTLGAITGGICEPLWGIPEEMKEKAMSYLPEEMKVIVRAFYKKFIDELMN